MKKLKCRTEDYTEADFPATRKEVFLECFREHFSLILKTCFLCLACFLPMIFVEMFSDLHLAAAIKELGDNPDEQLVASVVNFVNLVYGGIEVIAFAIFAFFMSGITQVVRQLCWNEPVFFGDDFKTGLKINGIKFVLVSLLASLTDYAASVTNTGLSYVLIPMSYVITLPIAIWYLLQTVYYNVGAKNGIKNGVLFYVKTFPITLLLLFLTVAPSFFITNFLFNFTAKYVLYLLITVVYFVPMLMVWLLYACHIFDKYVNKTNYPDVYRKGMLKKEN